MVTEYVLTHWFLFMLSGKGTEPVTLVARTTHYTRTLLLCIEPLCIIMGKLLFWWFTYPLRWNRVSQLKWTRTGSTSPSRTSWRYRFKKCSLGCVVQFMNHKYLLSLTQYMISRDILLSRMEWDLLNEIFSRILSCQNLHCISYSKFIQRVSHAVLREASGWYIHSPISSKIICWWVEVCVKQRSSR
jgi:hypothetical protein